MAAITEYKDFCDGLADLFIDGVKRSLTAPPASLAGVDLPASWPGLPRGNEPAFTFTGAGGWPAIFCDLIVAVEAVGNNTQSANYDSTVTVLDGLSTALRGASVGRAKLAWEINANVQVNVGGTAYWAVIATVEGR